MSARPPVRRAELLDRLELSPATLRRPVRDYSRGMRQKVGVIQALQHDPELAILDEPTEGLDPLMQYAFYAILDDLRRAGRTIFFSSHVLSEVERVCDRVAIVRRGRLVALEDIPTLLARRKRNVEMRLAGPPPDLVGVAGVSDVEVTEGQVRCRLEGDVGPFLAAIAGHAIHDLTIEPARLEEAFLEFYAEDAGAACASRRCPAARHVRGRRRRARMNRAVFAHVWRSNITRVIVVTVALTVWGTFLPIIYNAYGSVIKDIFASGLSRRSSSSSPSSAAATCSACRGRSRSGSSTRSRSGWSSCSRSGSRPSRSRASGSAGRWRSCCRGRSRGDDSS